MSQNSGQVLVYPKISTTIPPQKAMRVNPRTFNAGSPAATNLALIQECWICLEGNNKTKIYKICECLKMRDYIQIPFQLKFGKKLKPQINSNSCSWAVDFQRSTFIWHLFHPPTRAFIHQETVRHWGAPWVTLPSDWPTRIQLSIPRNCYIYIIYIYQHLPRGLCLNLFGLCLMALLTIHLAPLKGGSMYVDIQ